MKEKRKCDKCDYNSEENRKKEIFYLCSICYVFSPDKLDLLKKYVSEKVDGQLLDSFRKYYIPKGEKQKKGMMAKAISGNLMSRVPFGYKIQEKNLVPAENFKEIEEIFEKFLKEDSSLRQIASKHKLSVNGLKKVLRNFTYIGKIKFNNQIYQGNHQPIISASLFNHVQNKLEKLKIK